jgi:hypothetical protein
MEFVRRHESVRFGLSLELMLDVDPLRVRIDPRRGNYSYLGDRMRPRAEENFVLLVEDLIRHAPDAVLNRGAAGFADPTKPFFSYSLQRAFDEEVVWLIWQATGT